MKICREKQCYESQRQIVFDNPRNDWLRIDLFDSGIIIDSSGDVSLNPQQAKRVAVKILNYFKRSKK